MQSLKKILIKTLAVFIGLNLMAGLAIAQNSTKLPGIKATGKFENGYAKIDWEPVSGLGTTFDKYNVRYKKGNFGWMGAEAEGVNNAYVSYDYYNLGNLSSGTWSFMVMPVKMVNGKYQDVGEYGNTVTVEFPGAMRVLLPAPDVKMTVEGTMFKLSWEPLAGIGKDFDKYNVINKKGDLATLDGVSGGAYIDWNYYNLDVKEKGVTWTFQVVAVKNVNGEWKEVGKRSALLKGATSLDLPVELTAPAITKPTENETLTNFPREAAFEWTSVNGASYYEFEITCDVCVSSATKWLNPKTYSVNGVTFTKIVPGGDNEFRMRVRAVGTGSAVGPWSQYRYFRYNTAPIVPTVPQEPAYKGNNGKTYTESDFKSNQTNIWTDANNNYAKFCWDKPEKYFEGYALYTTEGLFEKSLTEYQSQYLDKGLDCYTYPKYFGSQGSVSVRLYPYIILENGARKFIQPGYQKTAAVSGNPAQVTPKKFGPVNLTGQYVNSEDMLKLDWEPLEGLGTKFDKYNIIWKKGYHNKNSIKGASVANSYVAHDYYNLLNLENGWWSFQVVPVKNGNGTYTEVGERSAVVRVFVQKNQGTPTPVEKDSINLGVVSWQNGLPKIDWSVYTEKAFDGYAMFVREGKWNKDQVTWVDPAYFEKTKISHQMEKMKELTGYTVRIVPYFINANGNKEFLYPASNTLYFETGISIKEIPPPTPGTSPQTKYCEGVTMPGWSGSDGSYDVCLGGILEHDTSWVTLKVLKLSSKLVKLEIEGANKARLVLKKGKVKKIYTDSDLLMSLTYDGVSPTTGGAMIRIETLELN